MFEYKLFPSADDLSKLDLSDISFKDSFKSGERSGMVHTHLHNSLLSDDDDVFKTPPLPLRTGKSTLVSAAEPLHCVVP